jgi:hypothetical protein
VIKIAYILFAFATLVPAALVAATCLYVLSQAELGPETDRPFGESMRYTTLGSGHWRITIHPRRWAAVAVLLASIFWFIGVVFLLFIRTS